MLQTLLAILVLGLIVCVHELGHYAAARLLGIEVLELALGFGKKLWQRISPKSGITYTLRLFPFGGYNRFVSADDVAGKHAAPMMTFETQPFWKRFITIAAGPGMNLLLALILSTSLWAADHVSTYFTACAEVQAAAEAAQENIFHLSVQAFGNALQSISESPGRAVEVIGGPLGAIMALQDYISQFGAYGVVSLMIIASVNMGLFNLLPLPGLDGCQLVMLLLEKVRGRQLSEKWNSIYTWVCAASFLVLFGVMSYNDISTLFRLVAGIF